MSNEFRLHRRNMVVIAAITCVVCNLMAWNPGRAYGTNVVELERSIGWPVVFYMDIWKSHTTADVNEIAYWFPIPLSSELNFSYSDLALIGIPLNLVFFAGPAVAAILLGWMADQKRLTLWASSAVILSLLASVVIFAMAEHFSAVT